MRNCVAVFVSVLCSVALCSERLKVADNSADTEVKDAISAAVRAFDSEDVRSYEMCFKESKRAFVRKKTALLFASEKCSMEIVDMHVIDIGEDSASAAVKYKMGCSSQSHDILSEINLVREGGRWVIDSESVKSKSAAGRASDGAGLFAARAPRAAPNNRQQGEQADGWDPMNPDRNRISPNLHHLMGDIGIREGMGCADGRCANGRCVNGRCPQ